MEGGGGNRNRSRGGGNPPRGLLGNNPGPNRTYNNSHPKRNFYWRSAGAGASSVDSNNNNLSFKSQVTAWKDIRKRIEELAEEKTKCLGDLQKREEETMKSHTNRQSQLLETERESIREKAKDREALKIKEEEFKKEQKEKLALIEGLRRANKINCDKDQDLKIAELTKELLDKENGLRREKDRILESFIALETQFTTKEKKLMKEICEERESLCREREELMDKLGTGEKNLNLEIQRFCQEVDRQASEIDKRAKFDPLLTKNKILERDVMQREQTLHHLHTYIAELEEINRMQHDQLQYFDSECRFQKVLIQQLQNEKLSVIAKAKSDGVEEYLRGEWHQFDTYDPNVHSHNYEVTQDQNSTQSSDFVLPHLVNGMQSPCFQSHKPRNGYALSDLRDRYEDINQKATDEGNKEKYDWTLAMLRKIVSSYEEMGMRVYEESSTNKYTSTFIWCPNDQLYPNKTEASFAMGHGNTPEEAIENAAHWALLSTQRHCLNGSSTAGSVDVEMTTDAQEPVANANLVQSSQPDVDDLKLLFSNVIPQSGKDGFNQPVPSSETSFDSDDNKNHTSETVDISFQSKTQNVME